MKLAHFDPTSSSNPAPVMGWYLVQDENDPGGHVYPNLPAQTALADVPDEIWADSDGRVHGGYGVDKMKSPPEVVVMPPIVLTPAEIKGQLARYAAAKRYEVETGGITAAGASIATDRDSQALINGAFNLVTAVPSTTVKFKTDSGFVTLDAAAVTAIATAVGQHVQACFAKEADVAATITAGATTTTAQVDVAFASLAA